MCWQVGRKTPTPRWQGYRLPAQPRLRQPAKQSPNAVAEQLYSVELADSFIERLASIEAFLEDADAAFAYDDLLSGLRSTVIPNLARFPLIGKRYLDQPPQSTEALAQLAQLPYGAADALRVYLHSDYLILYTVDAVKLNAYLLSIRHHRQLSFDFARLWPAPKQ